MEGGAIISCHSSSSCKVSIECLVMLTLQQSLQWYSPPKIVMERSFSPPGSAVLNKNVDCGTINHAQLNLEDSCEQKCCSGYCTKNGGQAQRVNNQGAALILLPITTARVAVTSTRVAVSTARVAVSTRVTIPTASVIPTVTAVATVSTVATVTTVAAA